MPALGSIPINQGAATQGVAAVTTSVAQLTTLYGANNYFLVQNTGTADLYLGFCNVTATSSMFILKPGASLEFANFLPLGKIWAYSPTTTNAVYLIA